MSSVVELFLLANRLPGSVNAHICMTKRAAPVNGRKELGVKPGTVTDEQDGSHKAFADAQIKETGEDLARDLDALRNSFQVRKKELLQERDE